MNKSIRLLKRYLTLINPVKSFLPKFYSTKKPIIVLGIETSCDDTSCALINSEGKILGECTISQYSIHEPNGGIVPNLALKHHIKNLPKVVRISLDRANLEMKDVDVVAFTRGPGLPSSLSVGLNAAKTLASANRKPLIGVHHMEAHALTVRMTNSPQVQFPYLAFLISGGHTLLTLVHNVNHFTILGSTLDESVGEAYDKVSRSLKLKWNKPIEQDGIMSLDQPTTVASGAGAGPALEAIALNGNPIYKFTTPLSEREKKKKVAFSFTGLRTQVSKFIEDQPILDDQVKADIACSFQKVVLDHLRQKLGLAFLKCKELNIKPTCLVAAGGVASNMAIKNMLKEMATINQMDMQCPPPRFCTDNGVMIAWAGLERYNHKLIDNEEIDFLPNWPLDSLKDMYQK